MEVRPSGSGGSKRNRERIHKQPGTHTAGITRTHTHTQAHIRGGGEMKTEKRETIVSCSFVGSFRRTDRGRVFFFNIFF